MESGSSDAYHEFADFSLFYVLPNEIVISIFRRLPVRDLSLNIPRVCKLWFAIATDNALWRSFYLKRWNTVPQSLKVLLNQSSRHGERALISPRLKFIPSSKWLAYNQKGSKVLVKTADAAKMLALEEKSSSLRYIENTLAIVAKETKNFYFQEEDGSDSSGDESCEQDTSEGFASGEDEEEDRNEATLDSPRMVQQNKENKKSVSSTAQNQNNRKKADENTRRVLLDSETDESDISAASITPLISSDEEDFGVDPGVVWKKQFITRLINERNWRQQNYSLSTLKGHSLAIMNVKFVGDVIYSCSLDGTIKCWNMTNRKCIATYHGHQDWVNSFDFNAEKPRVDRLVSCSFDTSIKVWNTTKAECVSTLWGHQNIVWSVKLGDDKIVSCSSDSTIRVWDVAVGTCLNTLVSNSGPVYCLHYDRTRNIAVSGSQDKLIRFWDLNSLNTSKNGCFSVMKGHTDRLCCLQYDGDASLVVSGSSDSTIKIWDTRMLGEPARNQVSEDEGDGNSRCCLRTLRGHTGRVCCLQFDHEKIVSGSDDNKIKVWSLYGEAAKPGAGGDTSSCCLNTLVDHDYWVNTLQFNETKLVSGAADDTIKIWDFAAKKKTGTYWNSSSSSYGRKQVPLAVASRFPVAEKCLVC